MRLTLKITIYGLEMSSVRDTDRRSRLNVDGPELRVRNNPV